MQGFHFSLYNQKNKSDQIWHGLVVRQSSLALAVNLFTSTWLVFCLPRCCITFVLCSLHFEHVRCIQWSGSLRRSIRLFTVMDHMWYFYHPLQDTWPLHPENNLKCRNVCKQWRAFGHIKGNWWAQKCHIWSIVVYIISSYPLTLFLLTNIITINELFCVYRKEKLYFWHVFR